MPKHGSTVDPLEPVNGDRSNFQLRLDALNRTRAGTACDSAARDAARDAASGGEVTTPKEEEPHVTKSLKRSGFAGCSTKELHNEWIDLEPFTALRYRVKSDGRKYVVSIRTDNWVTGMKEDLWQAYLFAPKGVWADVIIPRDRFLKTWRGSVLEHKHEMSATKVIGLGVAIAGGGGLEPEGPFRLEIASITVRPFETRREGDRSRHAFIVVHRRFLVVSNARVDPARRACG